MLVLFSGLACGEGGGELRFAWGRAGATATCGPAGFDKMVSPCCHARTLTSGLGAPYCSEALRQRCEYFGSRWNSGMSDATVDRIVVPEDFDRQAMEALVHWVYHDGLSEALQSQQVRVMQPEKQLFQPLELCVCVGGGGAKIGGGGGGARVLGVWSRQRRFSAGRSCRHTLACVASLPAAAGANRGFPATQALLGTLLAAQYYGARGLVHSCEVALAGTLAQKNADESGG